MREIELVTGEYYHLYSRGVDKRDIFSDDCDRRRFLQSLCLFNNQNYGRTSNDVIKISELCSQERFPDEKVPFVEIIAYILMPNHYHLFVRQEDDEGISRFMHKLQMGYTHYFNKKHERSGALFESTYKAKHVNSESYLRHLPVYIHLNALDGFSTKWREGVLSLKDSDFDTLENYRWSSHRFYVGLNQEYPIVSADTFKKWFKSKEEYLECLKEWSARDQIGGIQKFN